MDWLEGLAGAFPGQVRLQAIAQPGQTQPLIAQLAMQPELLARPAVWPAWLPARPALLLQALAQPAGTSTRSNFHGRQWHVVK